MKESIRMSLAEPCPKCGVAEKTVKQARGSGGLEMLLWLAAIIPAILLFVEPLPIYYFWMAFAVPAVGYSIWRWKSRYVACAKCKSPVELNWQPTNGPAVAGFVCGLMLHVPVAAGVCALVLGAVGRSRAKSGGGQGATLARIALFLGVLNIVAWIIVSLSANLAWNSRQAPPPPPLRSYQTP
jgi:hypothetical protein